MIETQQLEMTFKWPSNEYCTLYFEIVERAQNRQSPSGYVEKHHIVPKCFSGCDATNIVILTAREHFECHRLLALMFPLKSLEHFKMAHAWHRMSYGSQKREYQITPEEYELVRQLQAEISSLRSRGVPKSPKSLALQSEVQKIAQNRPEVKQRKSLSQRVAAAKPEVKQRQIISAKLAGKRPEVKRRRSDAQKLTQNDPELRRHRQETHPGKKSVTQLDLATGNPICTFSSIHEAARLTGAQVSNISACAHGRIPHACNFGWRYV